MARKRRDTSWIEDIVKDVTGKAEVPVWDASQHGYEEGAILFDQLGGEEGPISAAIWGIGKSATFHKPDEHVDVGQIPVHHEVLVRAYAHPQFKKK